MLVVYLDRAADNAPVTTATIEISLNGQPHKAELQSNGTYEITAPILKRAGQIEVLVNIADAGTSDLLVGALAIAPSGANATKATRTAIGERLLLAGAVAGARPPRPRRLQALAAQCRERRAGGGAAPLHHRRRASRTTGTITAPI